MKGVILSKAKNPRISYLHLSDLPLPPTSSKALEELLQIYIESFDNPSQRSRANLLVPIFQL